MLAAIHIRFSDILNSKRERDLALKARYLSGETVSALAREFGLTAQHVYQIINSGA
jgi:Mor family transcriptional regulator